MADPPKPSSDDVSVYLVWHSSGHCTIMTAFELPKEGHDVMVCTPHTFDQKSQHTYRSQILPKAQEMQVRDYWRKRIAQAWEESAEAVCTVLSDLENRSVTEVMARE